MIYREFYPVPETARARAIYSRHVPHQVGGPPGLEQRLQITQDDRETLDRAGRLLHAVRLLQAGASDGHACGIAIVELELGLRVDAIRKPHSQSTRPLERNDMRAVTASRDIAS